MNYLHLHALARYANQETLPSFESFIAENNGKHLTSEGLPSRLYCFICGRQTNIFETYETCLRSHLLQQAFACKHCGKACTDNLSFSAHQKDCARKGHFLNTSKERNDRHLTYIQITENVIEKK